MLIPYLLTTLLYSFVALFIAADASLVSVNRIGAFPALRWMRVHFITLGIVSQVVFGLLPLLVASLSKKPRPSMRWDIWLALNGGLVSLVAGFAGVNQPMILAGGTDFCRRDASAYSAVECARRRRTRQPQVLHHGFLLFAGRHHRRHWTLAQLERGALHPGSPASFL